MRYLLSDEQRDRRNPVGVLVAFRDGDLLQELHLLLTGQEEDLGLAKHHDGVGELVPEQPRLRTGTHEHVMRSDGISVFISSVLLHLKGCGFGVDDLLIDSDRDHDSVHLPELIFTFLPHKTELWCTIIS